MSKRKQMSIRLPKDKLAIRVYCLENNIPSGEAAIMCKCSPETYKNWARIHGYVPFRNNGYRKEEIDTIRRLNSEGMTDDKIGDVLGISKRSVQYVRFKNNIPPIKRYNFHKKKVEQNDNTD